MESFETQTNVPTYNSCSTEEHDINSTVFGVKSLDSGFGGPGIIIRKYDYV